MTDLNSLVAPIHPKAMPVLLDEEDEERWLTCSFDDAVALAKPFPSQLMTVRWVASTGAVDGGADPLLGQRARSRTSWRARHTLATAASVNNEPMA